MQHQNSTSATPKINVCNIKNMLKVVATFENKHLQHRESNVCVGGSTSAMLKNLNLLLQHPRETLATSL
jgi:hypothetical protein